MCCQTMFLSLSRIKVCGIILTFIARLKSELGSQYTIKGQSLPFTNDETLLKVLASSVLIAYSFTPVSSCHSSYASEMVVNSFMHGLHQVAQKLIIIGLPSFFIESVDIIDHQDFYIYCWKCVLSKCICNRKNIKIPITFHNLFLVLK